MSTVTEHTPLEDLPTILDLAETAALLRVDRETAYKLIREGDFPIPVKKVGTKYRVLKRDVVAFLTGEAAA